MYSCLGADYIYYYKHLHWHYNRSDTSLAGRQTGFARRGRIYCSHGIFLFVAGGCMKKFISKNTHLLLGAVFSAALLKPSDAAAHLVTTGMGPVYDGIGHLLLTPEDLVPALAVALYAGLRGRAPGRRALFFFPLAWLLGGFIGLAADAMPTFPVSAFSFLLVGILLAADLRFTASSCTIVRHFE